MADTPALIPPFTGFPRQGISFFHALALAQSREWFHAHKADYETLWRAPMQSLLEELRTPLAKIYGRKLDPPKIFRINRDVRYTNDKSPYKTHCAGKIAFAGAVNNQEGMVALYLHLGMEEEAGCGTYELDPDRLAHFRRAVIAPKSGEALARALGAVEKHGMRQISIGELKRAPSGIPVDHPRIAILRHKGLAVSFGKIPKAARNTVQLKEWLLAQAKIAAPVMAWSHAQKIGFPSAEE